MKRVMYFLTAPAQDSFVVKIDKKGKLLYVDD